MIDRDIKFKEYDGEDLLSKTISFLRFPLMVGVVLIHAKIGGEWLERISTAPSADFPIYATVSYLLSSIIASIAVPLYFFIAGFLFFYRTAFDSHVYLQKLKKRCKTLLVPYLLWNLIALLLTFALQAFFPDMVVGAKSVRDYSVTDYLWCFWDFQKVHHGEWSSMTPINDPLWFIRDLMVVILFSPLIHFLLKKLHTFFVLLLGILWLNGWWYEVPGFSIAALFFFSAGAYFSIHKKDFVAIVKRLPAFPTVSLIYVTVSILILCLRGESWILYLKKVSILIGIVLAVGLSARRIERGTWRVNQFLTEGSLFIYLYHGLIVYRLSSRLFLLLPHTDAMLLLVYFFCPTIIIFFGLFLYRIIKNSSRQITALLMGGR